MDLLANHSLCQENGVFSQSRYDRLTQKGFVLINVFKKKWSHNIFRCIPYEYITGLSSLEEESFPSWENFYSRLKAKNLDIETYKRTQTLWNQFSCKTLLDLLKIYQIRWIWAWNKKYYIFNFQWLHSAGMRFHCI